MGYFKLAAWHSRLQMASWGLGPGLSSRTQEAHIHGPFRAQWSLVRSGNNTAHICTCLSVAQVEDRCVHVSRHVFKICSREVMTANRFPK